MRICVASLALLFCASVASAQSCSDFYRFVDFGLTGSEGATYRGGVVLRAEGFDGAPLLLTDQTVCCNLRDLAAF